MAIFDSHFHLFEPSSSINANKGFLPCTYSTAQYLKQASRFNFSGGALVSSSFQAHSNDSLTQALSKLPDTYVGVASITPDITDEEINELHKKRIRGIRINLVRTAQEHSLNNLIDLAKRVHDLKGWHTEFYAYAHQLTPIRALLYQLPAFSIDHLGVCLEGLPELYKLVERGARVKASGFGRVKFDSVKIAQVLTEINAINPNALMFGSDLPGTRSPRAFAMNDIELIRRLFHEETIEKILHANAEAFYKIPRRIEAVA